MNGRIEELHVGIFNGVNNGTVNRRKSLEIQLAALLDTLPSDATVSYMVTRLNEGEEATIVASSKETIVHTGASMVKR